MLKFGAPLQNFISPLWHFLKNEKKEALTDIATVVRSHTKEPVYLRRTKGVAYLDPDIRPNFDPSIQCSLNWREGNEHIKALILV